MIESPCILVCKLDQNICIGCKRTIEEITDWSTLSDQQKQEILDRIVSSYVTLKKAAKTPTV